MKISNQKVGAAVLSIALFATPMLALAAGGLLTGVCVDAPNCTFNDLVLLANKIIKFLLYDVSIPLAAIGIMWAGAQLVLSQNKEGAWTEAKGRFADIGKGFAIMLGAYVLIKVILFSFLSAEQVNFIQFMIK